jgi:succinate dehydrogenase / fumarate reductase cytochrome b subunit
MILKRLVTSSVGRKTIVAVTGLLLILFILSTYVRKLEYVLGPDAMNSYAAKLQSLGGLL